MRLLAMIQDQSLWGLQMPKEKWIQAMHMKKGALHKELHVPEGKKIPSAKLKEAEKKGGKEGKRAHLAETLKKMHKK
jgi:hypothetical protein